MGARVVVQSKHRMNVGLLEKIYRRSAASVRSKRPIPEWQKKFPDGTFCNDWVSKPASGIAVYENFNVVVDEAGDLSVSGFVWLNWLETDKDFRPILQTSQDNPPLAWRAVVGPKEVIYFNEKPLPQQVAEAVRNRHIPGDYRRSGYYLIPRLKAPPKTSPKRALK